MPHPGITVNEAALPRVVTGPSPTESYGAFLGTALRGPTVPLRCDSWSDFVSNFGGFSSGQTLPPALFQFFTNGGTTAYVSRVLGTGATVATATYTEGVAGTLVTLVATAISPGVWGKGVSFELIELNAAAKTFSLRVRNVVRGVPVVVEKFTNLSLTATESRYVENIVNSTTIGSRYITIDDTANTGAPILTGTVNTPKVLSSGGVDGGAPVAGDYDTAFAGFLEIDALLVVNAPGLTTVTGLVTQVEARGDSVLICDVPENTLMAGVPGLSVSTSAYAATYYPWIYISDPSPDAPRGAITKVPPGASVAGMILRTDQRRGIFKAPAGVSATLNNAVTTERRLTTADLDALHAAKLNAIRIVSNAGVAVMGARTGANDTSQYISVRRTLNWVKKKAVNASRFALFEPNTPRLWDQLRVVNGAYLSQLYTSGGLAGADPSQAYYVKCDSDNNTPQRIAAGEVYVEIGVAPVYPAEFIIITVGQFEADASVVVTEDRSY